jgi:hypothetical protein
MILNRSPYYIICVALITPVAQVIPFVLFFKLVYLIRLETLKGWVEHGCILKHLVQCIVYSTALVSGMHGSKETATEEKLQQLRMHRASYSKMTQIYLYHLYSRTEHP